MRTIGALAGSEEARIAGIGEDLPSRFRANALGVEKLGRSSLQSSGSASVRFMLAATRALTLFRKIARIVSQSLAPS